MEIVLREGIELHWGLLKKNKKKNYKKPKENVSEIALGFELHYINFHSLILSVTS